MLAAEFEDDTSDDDDEEDEHGLGLGYRSDTVVRPSKFNGYDSVYKLNNTDPKQRNWYVIFCINKGVIIV